MQIRHYTHHNTASVILNLTLRMTTLPVWLYNLILTLINLPGWHKSGSRTLQPYLHCNTISVDLQPDLHYFPHHHNLTSITTSSPLQYGQYNISITTSSTASLDNHHNILSHYNNITIIITTSSLTHHSYRITTGSLTSLFNHYHHYILITASSTQPFSQHIHFHNITT